jgi:uncharacterized protein GlcG (DUF336 family)
MHKIWQRIALVAAISTVTALSSSRAESPFHDKPATPQSLPGDNLPPFGMLDANGTLPPPPPLPPGGLHRGPGSPPESTARGPSLELALAAAHVAVLTCSKAGYRVGAAVVDSVGEARAMLTADGSDGSHVFVAMRKALAALAFKSTSTAANARAATDRSAMALVTPAMFVEGGAVPIFAGSEIIGAIGVSGAGGAVIGKQDEDCATAGLRAIAKRLK